MGCSGGSKDSTGCRVERPPEPDLIALGAMMSVTSQTQALRFSKPMYILVQGRFGLRHFALYEPVCCHSYYRPKRSGDRWPMGRA